MSWQTSTRIHEVRRLNATTLRCSCGSEFSSQVDADEHAASANDETPRDDRRVTADTIQRWQLSLLRRTTTSVDVARAAALALGNSVATMNEAEPREADVRAARECCAAAWNARATGR